MKGENEMKRSFRVATVFTGAVACATALAPTVEAAPAAAADATAKNCAVNSGVAVHLHYAKSAKHTISACVNGLGLFDFGTGKRFSGICGGAYSGSFEYHVPGTNIYGNSDFSRGYQSVRFRQPDSIYWVSLHTYQNIQGFTSC